MKTHYKGCAKELLVSNYVKESVCHRGAEDGSVIHWWCLLWSYKIYEIKVEQLESNKRIKIKIFFVFLSVLPPQQQPKFCSISTNPDSRAVRRLRVNSRKTLV